MPPKRVKLCDGVLSQLCVKETPFVKLYHKFMLTKQKFTLETLALLQFHYSFMASIEIYDIRKILMLLLIYPHLHVTKHIRMCQLEHSCPKT